MQALWPMDAPWPPARQRHTRARPLPTVWLFVLLLGYLALIVPTALAQDEVGPTSSPTPSASLSMGNIEVEVESITPEVRLVGDILGTDVEEEFQQDQLLLNFLIQWDWQRLLSKDSAGGSNDTAPSMAAAPFVICAEGGRAAVEKMTNKWSLSASSSSSSSSSSTVSASRSLQDGSEEENTTAADTEPATTTATTASTPLYARPNLTCYIVQGSASDVLNLTVYMEHIKYLAPLPAILKLAHGLFLGISQGRLFASAEACATGIRVVLSPGIGTDEAAVTAFVASVQNDLRTGAFRDKLAAAFPFANETVVNEVNNISAATALTRAAQAAGISPSVTSSSSHSSAKFGPSKRLRQQVAQGVTTNITPTSRAARWWGKIEPVIKGTLTCDWASLVLSLELPYLSLNEYCALIPEPVSQLRKATACLTSLIAFLASHPEVLFLEAFPVVRPLNSVAGAVVQSSLRESTPLWDAGLDGSGQVIQVADTGIDLKSCYFDDPTGNVAATRWEVGAFDLTRRKVVQLVAGADAVDVSAGHGTHCAGSAAGNCGAPSEQNTNYRGVAYAARLAIYDGGSANGALSFPANLQLRMFPPGYKAGARVFSNSWGSNQFLYTFMDTEFDGFMFLQPDVLVLVAAGNTGANGFRTVFSPSLSKNALCVGASQSLRVSTHRVGNVAHFSARGPTPDGRIKPDLVSPGMMVTSANASSGSLNFTCTVVSKSGTSMATAVVAGAVALVRQYYLEGRYPSGVPTSTDAFVPTGALLKALLINSAVPMSRYVYANGSFVTLGLPPDNYQGFGRLQLDTVLHLVPNNPVSLFVRDAVPLAEEEAHSYTFTVPTNGNTSLLAPFKVTMTWTDPFVPASSGKIVLHDLDLLVVRRQQSKVTTHYPNGLTQGPDRINTVEKVVLYMPAPGDIYTVTVTGASISTTPFQTYALVVSGANVVMGAWYCQDSSMTRVDTDYKTSYCATTCASVGFRTAPICCGSDAGATCDPAARKNDSLCMAASAPPPPCPPATTAQPTMTAAGGSEASMISLAPTRMPTATANVGAAPSRSPTKSPTLTPSKVSSHLPSMKPSQASSPSHAPSLPPTNTLKPSEEGEVAWQETGNLDPAPNAASGAGRQKFAATTIFCMVLSFFRLLWW